ncbi:MAG: TadE/TadG family type IV pilus assembly protein [Sinobacteraceae bacterium]|nr:TadE/TadG family type IV pilus assembly protein [Nevskiaceae bacterium]
MMVHRMKAGSPGRQHGAVAVEFAFVFPILLGLAYSVIVYSMVYVFQQAINFAAQQGAEAAVAVIPGVGDRNAAATTAVNNTLTWLSGAGIKPTVSFTGCSAPAGAYVVRVSLSRAQLNSFLPPIANLPLLGTFPPLPPNGLAACAVAVS